MKRFYPIILLLLICSHTLKAQTEKTVTFSPATEHSESDRQGANSISKEGVTISTTNGILGYESEYRIYFGCVLTISTTTGNITEVVLNGTGSNPPSNLTKPSSGKMAKNSNNKSTWKGETQTLTLENTGGVVWLSSIAVTVVGAADDSGKTTPALSFSSSSVTATIGEPFTPPTLSKPDEVTGVTYQSSNTTLATVDAETGAVTIGESTGSVTITVTTTETEHYQAATVSYTILIKRRATTEYGNYPDSYLLVTDAETLQDGDRIIFVHPSAPSGQTMTTLQQTDFRDDTTLRGYNPDGSIIDKFDYAVFTVEQSGDYWCFHDELGYLYASSNNQNALGTRSDITADAQAQVTITNGEAQVRFMGGNSHRFLRFSNGKEGFVCTSSSTSLESVKIYRKAELPTDAFTISDAGFATLYADHEVLVPTGITAHTIANAEGVLHYGVNYVAGDIIPAQTPILLQGNEGNYTYYITNTDAIIPQANLLRGSTGERDDEAGYLFYKLAWRSATDHTAGFYFDSPDGRSIQIAAGKAYLAVPEGGASAKGYSFSEAVTAIGKVWADVKASSVFRLNGQYVGKDGSDLKKGIYIQNGRKIVIK